MIVEVVLRVTDDTGLPAAESVARRLVVQTAADYEGNLLKSAAALDDLVERCHGEMRMQVQQLRGADPMLHHEPPPDDPRRRPRGRR